MKKVSLNKEKCIGCGSCTNIASENFSYSDEGKAELINDKVTDEAIEASEVCPTEAIEIVEQDTKSINFKSERCIGCGNCVNIAPNNFKFNDEGKAELINEEITDEVKKASAHCPTEAILFTTNENSEK